MTASPESSNPSSLDYVTMLVEAALNETCIQNDEHLACYQTMQRHALAFSNIMRGSGCKPDTATFIDESNIAGYNIHEQPYYKRSRVSFWTIREHGEYGGEDCNSNTDRYHDETMASSIGIGLAGALLIIRTTYGSRYVNPDEQYGPNDFIDRSLFDKPDGTEKVLAEWALDLKNAVAKYARKG